MSSTSTSASAPRDLVIIGGGLIGLTMALAAARKGLSSHVIDRATPEELTADGVDGRASAISTASWNLFGNIGLADVLEPLGCPIAAIAVSDQLKPGQIDFRPAPEDGSLGRMFANRDIRIALHRAVSAGPLIHWHGGERVIKRQREEHGVCVTLASGGTLTGSLMIGAEGRQSPTREEAGITSARWDYSHSAVVTALAHEKPHDNVAWEIFYPAGPFALLPLLDLPDGRHRSALVWTVARDHAYAMLALPERAFIAEASQLMGHMFGPMELVAPRAAWPLNYHRTAKITAHRLALVGDAAHGIHPIAGQGFNLGLRDVGALIEVLSDGQRLGLDIGDAQVLARYERWRSLDSFSVGLATDGLNRLFSVPGRLPSAVRRLGMGAVQRLPLLKQFFMDEARGVSGTVPRLMQG